MKRIQRLLRLRDCGIFRDFSWPSGLPEFGKCNLIYGWNGTGKTTLSRLLRDLELNRLPKMGKATLKISDRNVRGDEFPDAAMQIRVFNREFVQENVFSVKERNIPPILVLGAKNVEKQKDIERLTKLRSTVQEELNAAQKRELDAQRHFDSYCRDRAKIIKDTLRASGDSLYNNYDRSNFKRDAENMIKADNSETHRLVGTERDELLAQHLATPKPKIDEICYTFRDLGAIVNSLSNLLKTTVVSEAIKALTNNPTLADWTRQGLVLQRKRGNKLCQFCEQPLPKGRIAALEKHFNDQYEQFIQHLDKEIKRLKATSMASKELDLPASAALYDKFSSEFESRLEQLKKALKLVQKFTEAAAQALQKKKARVFEEANWTVNVPSLDTSAAEKLNSVISQHNTMSGDFKNYVKNAREKLANDMIAADLEEFAHRKTAINSATKSAEAEKEKVRLLGQKIEDLERQIIEHRQPAEELSGDMQKYLGHSELCLEIKENGYLLTRSGMPAKALSEGETTAVALLYFLKSLRDKRFSLDSGIVVLDDPVSSLDANALFLAFGFIRERTAEVGQLFILTHNFSFFRQVRNWFQHLNKRNSSNPNKCAARFFMLDSSFADGTRNSTIQQLDPLLERFESEYQYLFARIYRASIDKGPSKLGHRYDLPNVARRMLEAFLAFRLPQNSGTLWQRMKEVQFDEAKKIRILRFLNTHSHSIAVGEPEHDLTALAEAPAVLKDLLEMIESLDCEHHKAMVHLTKQ